MMRVVLLSLFSHCRAGLNIREMRLEYAIRTPFGNASLSWPTARDVQARSRGFKPLTVLMTEPMPVGAER